ncbi:MAG TPA: hypothetical protein VFF77_08515, partial [Holophagaceae bacterium]|nr:hypothetical protein [Holophagaceae bacterium]
MILQDWWYTTLLDSPWPFQAPLCEHIQTDALVVGHGAQAHEIAGAVEREAVLEIEPLARHHLPGDGLQGGVRGV